MLLHHVTYGPSVKITGATKLNMLGYLGTGFLTIQLGDSIFKAMVPVSLVEQFSTVRILALLMPRPELKFAIGYLSCFPRLERLHVEFGYRWPDLEGARLYDPLTPIECLDHSLKIIVLRPYEGRSSHVEFARFFVERARVLEFMEFGNCRGSTTSWAQDQHRQLNIENKASMIAQC
ncbi:hypothetical protein ACP70R_024156 [Stipagrostis hirtigluma subsp. patula]